ncbi:MAG: lysylphosphatidylglycerol synthase transmembrane domain-containing protein, partial [Pirellulales bacterium]
MKRIHIWILRICVSLALLACVFWFLPIRSVWAMMRTVPATLWLAILVVYLGIHTLAAVKWWLLTSQTDIRLAQFIRAHLAGLMGSLCLPGVAGGDIVRCAWVLRFRVGAAQIGVASVADRIVDTVALLVLAAVGAVFVREGSATSDRLLLMVAIVLGLGLTTVLSLIAAILYWRPQEGKLSQIANALEVLIRRPWLLMRTFLFSLAIQACFVGLNVMLGKSIGVEVGVSIWFLCWPLAKLAALMPVTMAGLGVRESALILLMQPFGAEASSVAA